MAAFKISYYTEVQDLSYLLQQLNEQASGNRFKALNSAVCELVEDFGLVHFEPLFIEVLIVKKTILIDLFKDKIMMTRLLELIDKASGYVFSSTEVTGDMVWALASRAGWGEYDSIDDVQERWKEYENIGDA